LAERNHAGLAAPGGHLESLRHGLPVLVVILPLILAWREWLKSGHKLLAGWRRRVFSSALSLESADVALTSALWFYFWATPSSGIEIVRWALLFGLPVSASALALLVIGRGRGWWLATTSPAITLGGWMVAYCSLSR